eukprot:365247-Chlamydomonas_euryale.AAC.5
MHAGPGGIARVFWPEPGQAAAVGVPDAGGRGEGGAARARAVDEDARGGREATKGRARDCSACP